MKKNNKKGFTIVELVIVIAVIAILAAVLIPTFSSVIKKAKVNNDIQLVRNLNTALATDTKEHKTMQDALDAAFEFGYDVAKINNTSVEENEILWDSVNDCFVYLKDGTPEYIPNSKKTNETVQPYQFWQIANTIPETQTYSIYAGTGWSAATVENLTVGFDAGTTKGITAIEYKNTTATPQEVVIRTNSFNTTLTINDSSTQGKIYHYDNLGKLIITNCAMESYHEMGIVGYAELQKGHLAVEENASINLLFANPQDSATLKITNNGTITNAQASSETVKNTISGVDFNRGIGAIVSNEDIQQSVQVTHQSNCEHANVVVSKDEVKATCTQKGSTVEKKCQDCNKILVEQQEIPMIPHSFVSVDAVSATNICTVCGALNPEIIANGKLKDDAFNGITSITTIVIPEGVKEIGTQAFKGCANLTSVTIPEGVTTIGTAAFQDCTGLTSVTIPDSVTKIGDSAFYGCSNLTTITIGKGLNTITVGNGLGDSFGRTKLTTITVDPENATYMSAGNALLNKEGTKLILGTASTVIPDTVTTIGNRAFLGREGLTTITIPARVTTIEDYAFSESSLTTIVIPSNVTSIGQSAFMSCKSLTTVTLNANITEIATGLFSQCSNLESITIPSSVETIGGSAFYKCTKLTSITIPASVKTIGKMAFLESGLTSAIIEGNNTWRAGQNDKSMTNISQKLTSDTITAQYLNGQKLVNGSMSLATQIWKRT